MKSARPKISSKRCCWKGLQGEATALTADDWKAIREEALAKAGPRPQRR